MSIFSELFAWWTGNTIGTRVYTLRKGVPVGEDSLGNRYYRERNGPRRWVIYKDLAEASLVPPEWHGWLHHTFQDPPTGDEPAFAWEKGHEPNLTGTLHAYKPSGSLSRGGKRQTNSADYESWSP